MVFEKYMNICFLMGQIINDVKFDFVLNSKHDSIAKFKLKLLNNSEINIVAYDEKADYCYRRLNQNDVIYIYGLLDSKLGVIVKRIYLT